MNAFRRFSRWTRWVMSWRAPLLALALAVLALALWGGAPAGAREAAPKAGAPAVKCVPVPGDISVGQAQALLADPPGGLIILDVRTPQEFREGHLAGARNMDFFGGNFEMQTEALPKDAPVLIYCRTGKRSAAAAEILGEAGVKRIFHMHQGINGWKDAGLPLEK